MLDVPILDPLTTDDDRRGLGCTDRGAEATGERTEDGLVVFEDSKIAPDIAPSASETVWQWCLRLLVDGVLIEKDDRLVLAEARAFNSPSGAAGVMVGCRANGRRAWTDADRYALDEAGAAMMTRIRSLSELLPAVHLPYEHRGRK